MRAAKQLMWSISLDVDFFISGMGTISVVRNRFKLRLPNSSHNQPPIFRCL